MKQKVFLLLALLVMTGTAGAQSTVNPVHNDTLHLSADPLDGTIQWQQSSDSLNWTDIPGATTPNFSYIVSTTQLPQFFRALISRPDCTPYFSQNLSAKTDMPSYYWSDPAAWDSGQVPQDGEIATISTNKRIWLDVNTANLAGLEIEGELRFMERDLQLTSAWILVSGAFHIGSESNPFTHKAIIELNGSAVNEDIMGMGTRGILVMDGILELHGATPALTWTKINQHAAAGATSITLQEAVNWQVGDHIVLAPTDYFEAAGGASITQELTITAISGTDISFTPPLDAFRWGLLQYATPTGISLDGSNLIAPPVPDTDSTSTPLMLDERASVGLLTRNIVIQAPNDTLWTNQGFGVHTMIMGQDAVAHLEGIEIQRGGQRGRLRRYPLHWHMLSYSGTNTLADATGQYLRRSAIHETVNRGLVIHGTNGLAIEDNVLYNIQGHGIFTEDAVERRNLIHHNLVLHVRNANLTPATALKQHEIGGRGASCFWISNPDNTITNNLAADCSSSGFWLAFPVQPWGESISVLAEDGLLMNPSRTLFGTFENNTAHSNRLEGVMLDNVEIDNLGNTYPHQYISTINGRDPAYPFTTVRRFALHGLSVWKNMGNGIWDRSFWPDNTEIVSADNCGRFFAGSGADGLISRSLVVGTSLNHPMNGTDRPAQADFSGTYSSSNPVAFATYHSAFDITNNLAYHFPPVADTRSGVFSTDDYYLRPVEKGQIRNVNNVMIDCHSGVKLNAAYNYFKLASALWDPHGIWGPDSNYIVYDDPFLTTGKTITTVSPGTAVSGGVSVPGPFYGFEGFVLHGVGDTPPQNQPYFDLMGLYVRRLDQNLSEIATWSVPSALPAYALQHMRHFATSPDAIYELTFPEETVQPTDFQVNVDNMLTTADLQVIGFQFDGNLNPIVRTEAYGNIRNYTAVASLTDLRNSGGGTYWQDKANNRVWVHIQGGDWQFWTSDPLLAVPTNDELLYEPTVLHIFEP